MLWVLCLCLEFNKKNFFSISKDAYLFVLQYHVFIFWNKLTVTNLWHSLCPPKCVQLAMCQMEFSAPSNKKYPTCLESLEFSVTHTERYISVLLTQKKKQCNSPESFQNSFLYYFLLQNEIEHHIKSYNTSFLILEYQKSIKTTANCMYTKLNLLLIKLLVPNSLYISLSKLE